MVVSICATPCYRSFMGLLNLIALLLSPVIAVGVTLFYQVRKEKRDARRELFATLIATRHSQVIDQTVRALNLIDVAFHDSPEVRRLWHEYYDMLNNQGLNNEQGWRLREKKNR